MYFIVKPKNIRALLGTMDNELPYYERVFVKNRCLRNPNRAYAVWLVDLSPLATVPNPGLPDGIGSPFPR